MVPLAVAVGEPIATAVPVRPRQSFPPGKCRPSSWISTGTVYPLETLVRQWKIPIIQWKIRNSIQIIQFQMVNQGKIHGNQLQNENLRARPLPRRPGSTPGGAGMVMCWKITFWYFLGIPMCFHVFHRVLIHPSYQFHYIGPPLPFGFEKSWMVYPDFPNYSKIAMCHIPVLLGKTKKLYQDVSYLISRYKPH